MVNEIDLFLNKKRKSNDNEDIEEEVNLGHMKKYSEHVN